MHNVSPLPNTAPPIPGDLDLLTTEWLVHRQARGAGRNTLDAYRRDLRLLRAYLARFDITLVQLVSERLLNRWIDDGIVHLGWSRRTAARRMACVRSFLAWCRVEGYLKHDPAADVRISFDAERVVAPEMDVLRPVITSIGNRAPLDLRDRAILMLLLDAALRAAEVAALDVPRADADGRLPRHTLNPLALRVHVPAKGKGAVQTLGIEEQTADAVHAWLRVRDTVAAPGEPALFVNTRGQRLHRSSIYQMVRDRGAAAGVQGLHPHLFRHRRIGDVVERLGLDIGNALARHKHKATTANVYGAHAAEVQRAAIRTLAPLGEVLPCNG